MSDQLLFMKPICFLLACFFAINAKSQELYVYTEPASNMPAHSISVRIKGEYMKPQPWHNRNMERVMPELMFGLNKKWMLHVGSTFGNMHTNIFAWESVYSYLKYRFFSRDDI